MSGLADRRNLLTPESVFSECLFRVPDYQRGYAWERQQRDELVEDLELLPKSRAHYTGTLVFNPVTDAESVMDKRGNSYFVVDIVDGQQRLTTLILLLDAIRDSLAAEGKTDLADGVQERYIAVRDPNGQLVSKITLNRDCHHFFHELVVQRKPPVRGPSVRSHQNLQNAYDEFREYLSSQRQKRGKQYLQWLMSMRSKISRQLNFTVYVVDEASEVGVIFEVMNNRGLHITEMEKVKNYLLYLSSKLVLKVPHDFAEQVNEAWTFIFESLMRSGLGSADNEDRLLRMHWLMAYDYNTKNWHGSKSIKEAFHLREYVEKHEDLLNDLKEYVAGLKDATTVYCDVESPDRADSFKAFASDQELRQRIVCGAERLRRLDVLSPFIPLLMSIRLRLPNDGKTYLKALELCEKFSFRVYRLLRYRADAGRSTFYMLASGLFEGLQTPSAILNMVAALIHSYSPEEDFNRKWELTETNNWYGWGGLVYFLYEYEDYLAQGTPVRIPWSMLERAKAKKETVEHILPQTPKEGEWTEFSEENRKKYTHDIGNLCLTFNNSNYWRKPFEEKKGDANQPDPCYANAKLLMERELAKFDDWNVDTLLQRRGQIVAWAKERWKAPKVAAKMEAVEEELTDEEPPDEEPQV